MQRQSVRVIVASEYPEVRDFLREVVEEQGRAVIVGQAENATTALTLARRLRPDVAIVDCYLPHVIGLDTVPLSRIGGLDAAQTIAEEIPNTRVIVSTKTWKPSGGESLPTEARVYFSRETAGTAIPFTLQELYREEVQSGTVVFARVEVKSGTLLRQKVSNWSGKALLFGGLGILGGLGLMFTVLLAGAGVVLALAGAATLLLGLVGKLATLLLAKAK